jgi:histidinol-phosphate aminotransferase
MRLDSIVRKAVLGVTPYTPGKPIEELQRELGLPRAIKLASNENPLGPSPKAIEAIRTALGNLHRYPDASGFSLVQKLASHLGVSPEQVVLGNGSDEIIVLATRAFLEPAEEVVIASPTFLIYRIAAQVAAAKIRIVPLQDFRYNLAGMRRAIRRRTKMVFIANPDNPTGTYVTRKEVEAFMEDLPDRVVVFFDEAYAELVDVPDYPDTRIFLKRHPVIVARSFSKTYGLAGIRIGYGITHPRLASILHRVREPFNVNALAQVAAMAALDDRQHLEATRTLLKEEKPKLYAALKELGLTAIPSSANFILFHVGPMASQIHERLLRRGVIVRYMGDWGLPEYLRVSVGLPEENQVFIQTLREELER